MLNFASEAFNLYTSTCALKTVKSNKEREVQNVGDDDIKYEQLLNDIDLEILMDEDAFWNWHGVTKRAARCEAGGSQPKNRGVVRSPGNTRNLKGTSKSMYIDICSRFERSVLYDWGYDNWLSLRFIICTFDYHEFTKFQRYKTFDYYIFVTPWTSFRK